MSRELGRGAGMMIGDQSHSRHLSPPNFSGYAEGISDPVVYIENVALL